MDSPAVAGTGAAAGAKTPGGEKGANGEGSAPSAGAEEARGVMVGLQTPGTAHVGGTDTPGSSSSLGATPGGSLNKLKGFSMQPSQRFVIYYDKNGNELQRKLKGPGRLPRGAVLEGENYIVRDCVLNKNTQEVMTLPTYVPPEQKKEKERYRLETENFLGSDFVNNMAANMSATRPPPRAVRMKTGPETADEENPYAKYRYVSDMSHMAQYPEAQHQKGSAAYAKRVKSPYHFPAPVPAEDREKYDKGYSLLPDGGRGEYLAPPHQLPGEEQYGLTFEGVFELLSPGYALSAPPPRRKRPPRGTAHSGGADEYDGKEGGKVEGIAAKGEGREQVDEKGEGRPPPREQVDAAAGVKADVQDDAMEVQEDEEKAETAHVLALWRSLGAPGADVAADGVGECAIKAEIQDGAQARAPTLWLEGRQFSIVDVLRAVLAFGGSSKVQSWGLVGEQLLQSSRSDNNPKGASSDAATTAVPGVRRDVPYVIVAQQIREFFAKTRLELVEERLAATGKDVLSALAEQGRASWLGSWIGAASEVTGDKMVVMEPQGICHDIGEGLVHMHGRLLHADMVRQSGSNPWQLAPEKAAAYAVGDMSWEAQKKWWAQYQTFARANNLPADSPNFSVYSACGQRKSLALFMLYFKVRARGGIEQVVASKGMSELVRELDMRWTPALAFELRRVYIRSLYAYEIKELRGINITVGPEHDLLFCVPIKHSTARAVAAARQVALPLDPTCLGLQEGLAGVMGTRSSGTKRVLQRTGGNHAPEDAFERQKRLCRSLDSRCRRDVQWSLGVLIMSSWEAAKGIEPHVAITDAIASALCRYLRAALMERPPLAAPRFVLFSTASSDENMELNVETVLTILHNYTCVPHLAAAYAYNRDLVAALGLCLIHGSDDARLQAMEVLAHIALPPVSSPASPACAGSAGAVYPGAIDSTNAIGNTATSSFTGGTEEQAAPAWFTALLPQTEVPETKDAPPAAIAHANACPLTSELIEGLNTVGHLNASTALFTTYLRVVALLVELSVYHDAALAAGLKEDAVESNMIDSIVHPSPLQTPVFDFIAAAAGPSRAFKCRLSNCEMLVGNIVHVLICTHDGRLQQAHAACALACILNTDSPRLKTTLLQQKEELIAVTMSTNATRDVATDMAQVLVYFSALESAKPFKPTSGAAREAALAAAAVAAATSAAAEAAAHATWRLVSRRDDDSDDEDGPRQPGARGSGKYRCGVCGQIKKGHDCPGYWVEGEPK